jgi:hypothetical protein
MSKSLGNGIEPQAVSQKLGAEIIRLWVAASDYSGDIAGDDKILARVVDAYRRIRNTLRFLLANTSATSTPPDAVPAGRAAGDRPLGAGARGRAAGRHPEALRGLRVPPGGGQAAGVLQRGPGRVLPRRAEGPPLHHRAEVAGAAQRRRPRCGRSRTPCCAGWRPSSASPPRKPGRCSRRQRVDLHRDLLAFERPTRRCWPSGRASARSATRSTRRSRPCARPARGLVAAGQRDAGRRRRTIARCSRWATT